MNAVHYLLYGAALYAVIVVILCLWFKGATTLPTPQVPEDSPAQIADLVDHA